MWAGTFGVWRDHVLKHKRRVKLKLNRGPKLNSRIVLQRHRVVPSNYWLPAQSVTLPAIRKPWRDLLSTLIWHSFFQKLFDTFAEKFLHPFSWPAPDLMCQLTNKVISYFFGFASNVFCPQLRKTLHVWTAAYEYNADFELSLALCVFLWS